MNRDGRGGVTQLAKKGLSNCQREIKRGGVRRGGRGRWWEGVCRVVGVVVTMAIRWVGVSMRARRRNTRGSGDNERMGGGSGRSGKRFGAR